jgi:dolichyl-phosphate beta-glucosyltransferase
MYGLSLSVVIPAFNEERRIEGAVRAIHSYLTEQRANAEILVVDDGSVDRTAGAVSALQSALPGVKLLRLGRHYGKGRSVAEGMLNALGQFVLFTDADQSTSIEHLPLLLRPMLDGKCQLAIASRSVKGAVLVRRQPWYRELLGKGFGVVMRALLVRGVRDSQCGFKCFTRDAAHTVFSELVCQNGLFDMEALLIAARHGLRAAEVPVRWSHDPDSRLRYSPLKALGLFLELLKIRRRWRVGWPERLDVVPVAPPGSIEYQNHDYEVRAVDGYAAKKYEIILSWLAQSPCSRVLNVGCGSGELNVLLATRGYSVDALDPSESAVRLAQARAAESGASGISVRHGDLYKLRPNGAVYDAILCLDVIEHLKHEREAAERLAAALRPRGVLLLSVPALQALYGYHDVELGHYRRYSLARVKKLLHGLFDIERARYFGFFLIPIALLYSKLLRHPYPVQKSSGALGRFVLDLEGAIQPPLGTSLLVQARKRAELSAHHS